MASSVASALMGDRSAAFSVKSGASNATISSMPSLNRTISTSYPRQTYYELARAMKAEIDIEDRTYLLKTYNQCFLGSDAVDFIMKYLELESPEEAVEVGREMNEKIHCWEHVCGDHDLKDKKLFYQFTDSSKRQEGCLAAVMKSRRANKAPEISSLIDDSDSEYSDEEQEKVVPDFDLALLLKEVDVSLRPATDLGQPEEEEVDSVAPEDDRSADSTRPRRPRPRPRPGSHRPRRDRDANSPVRRERSPRSRSPKPSQARVQRRDRGRSGGSASEQRSRSKSPRKTPSGTREMPIQKSSTFHGRGRGEARKQLLMERPGNKRITAMKKKQESLRKMDPEQEASLIDGEEELNAAKPMRERAASLKVDQPFLFPKHIEGLPPRSSSAPIRLSGRQRSPVKGRTPITSKRPIKKEEEKDFLRIGHASWGPDSEEFLLLSLEDEDDQEEGHSSLSVLPSNESGPKARSSLDKKMRSTIEKRASFDSKGSRSRSSRQNKSSQRRGRTCVSVERRSRSSLENRKCADKGSSHSVRSSTDSKAKTGCLDKLEGSNHSFASTGGNRSSLLASLYCQKPRTELDGKGSAHSTGGIGSKRSSSPTEENGSSLRDVEGRHDVECHDSNPSILSALNE